MYTHHWQPVRGTGTPVPREELPEFCPELGHDPVYRWLETVHHADRISTDRRDQLNLNLTKIKNSQYHIQQ